jgi:hypothetical protein
MQKQKKSHPKFTQTAKCYLACLAACLLPFVASAQGDVLDHNWTFETSNANLYGVFQLTSSKQGSYTFFCFGKKMCHVHAKAVPLATVVLASTITGALILERVVSLSRKTREPKE